MNGVICAKCYETSFFFFSSLFLFFLNIHIFKPCSMIASAFVWGWVLIFWVFWNLSTSLSSKGKFSNASPGNSHSWMTVTVLASKDEGSSTESGLLSKLPWFLISQAELFCTDLAVSYVSLCFHGTISINAILGTHEPGVKRHRNVWKWFWESVLHI